MGQNIPECFRFLRCAQLSEYTCEINCIHVEHDILPQKASWARTLWYFGTKKTLIVDEGAEVNTSYDNLKSNLFQ